MNTSTTAQTSQPDSIDFRSVVNHVATSLVPFAEEYVNTSQLDDAIAGLKRLNCGVFRLVVMGEIKKGKSSFINAFLSEPELLPTDSDIATSIVFKILYGPKKQFKVFFFDDGETGQPVAPLVVQPDQLMDYGTEKGNPNNEKRVDFIAVELPNPLLQSGLVIVDTPGVGGLFKAHRDITWRFAPNADAILFVVDSVESVMSADEIAFLRDLTEKFAVKLLFVQTKIDAASEELWRGWEDRNKTILKSELGLTDDRIVYFPVSASTKNFADEEFDLEELEDSGYPPLMRFVAQTLLPSKERFLAAKAAVDWARIASKVSHEMDIRLSLASETTSGKIQEIETQRREAISKFNDWELNIFKPLVASTNETVGKISRDSLDELESLLQPSGNLLADFVSAYRGFTADEMQENLKMIQQDFMERCAEASKEVFDKFSSGFENAVGQAQKALNVKATGDVSGSGSSHSRDIQFRKVTTLDLSSTSVFESTRNIAFAGVAGYYLSSMVISAIFPPVGALSLVAAAFGLYGASETGRVMAENRNAQAFTKLRGILADQLSQVRRSVVRDFEDRADKCSKGLNGLFEAATSQMRADLQRDLDDAKAAAGRTHAESQEVVAKLRAEMMLVGKHLTELRRAFPTMKA
ncbi:dynamin family protein [Aporhodopirellula aestuarii]|uniref:Dynamin family protein n=1 Tax=Aporhodopirellula aestuarii TaxID=2950107 RepID=A0ABT0U5D6_9BACT|nr:dynamin family protein [Aporhodopirellula aestuarii]MCM2371874.1 dynamin family protein [Aporhodopirellula aestuarii]